MMNQVISYLINFNMTALVSSLYFDLVTNDVDDFMTALCIGFASGKLSIYQIGWHQGIPDISKGEFLVVS